MTKVFVTGAGAQVEIGREIGKGGEGSVFDVPANNLWVAKIYNARHLPDSAKQDKLRYMASSADRELLNYAAWPQQTLHTTRNGPVVGFLMPKVSGRTPVHMLYSPAMRKQDYPQSAWDFLLFAARNTAAAFDAIHNHGHVLGDVNQGNVLVGSDSKVVLIDTDSFQISANGTLHLCKVGVPHFTPPELQGAGSFDRTPRTSNHDNFGLALLVFHLLFGGRHPYSGVPLKAEAGDALEKDIKAFRYAYAPDGKNRGFNPPPNSIPISLVPDSIQGMFVQSFTEAGASSGRPTARHWMAALDGLRAHLKKCSSTSMHVYPGHLERCPWCALENQGVIYFLDLQVISSGAPGSSSFVITRVWASIEAISAPPSIAIPNIASISVRANPLPPGIKREGTTAFARIVIVGIAIWLLAMIPTFWFFIIGGALWAWTSAGEIGGDEFKAEQSKRKAAQESAQSDFDRVVSRIRIELSPEIFHKKKQEYVRLKTEYLQLPEREKAEIANLYSTAESRQKAKFLERHFIETATISGVGPAKKAALRSFGIETAADVTWASVIKVKGFGEVLTRAVVDWKKACERRFVFNQQNSVTEADKNAVRAKIATRRRAIESQLSSAPTELQRLRQELINKGGSLVPMLNFASQKLAQAQADMKLL